MPSGSLSCQAQDKDFTCTNVHLQAGFLFKQLMSSMKIVANSLFADQQ